MLKETGTALRGGIFITNEDYLKWKPLIKKVAWKYRNNHYKLDLDDLEQIAAIGVIKGIDSYDEESESSLSTWLFNNAKWSIFRAFDDMERVKRQSLYNTVSLSTPINEEDDIYLEETIPDDSVNVENEIVNELMLKKYKEEINLCIYNPMYRDVVNKSLFTELSLNEIGKQHNISREEVRQIKNKGYRTLREKSPMIRAKYLEYQEREEEKYFINEYRSNPESIVLRKIISVKIMQKYNKEIEILNLIQRLFNFLDGYSYDDLIIKNFYLNEISSILTEKDIAILNMYIFLKYDLDVLISKGYDIYEVLGNKREIKKKIIDNKEQVCEIWRNYIERDREKVNELSC